MDAADLVGIVIDQGHGALAVRTVDFQFFVQFAFDRSEVSGPVEMGGVRVAVVHVAADPDGHLGVESCFTSGFAACVAEHAVAVPQDEIRNDLLVRGICLGGRTGQEKVVLRVEEGGHVAVGFKAQALKGPEGFEHVAWNNEDIFGGV